MPYNGSWLEARTASAWEDAVDGEVYELPWYLHPLWREMEPLSPGLLKAIGVVMTAVGLAGSMGNLVVILLLFRCKKLQTAANMYVFNLAAADLCMCLGNFPLLIVSSFEGRWTSGFLGCKIYSFLGGLAGFVSINTLTAMACDRYNVIYRYKGLLKPGSRRHSLGLLVSIWIYSAMWAAPPFLGWGGFSLDGGQISCCFDYLDRSASNVSYIIAIFVFCFGIQVVVIMFCYVSVVQAVYQHEQILKKGNMNVRLYQNHFHQHSANFTANNHNNHHLAGTSAAIPATTGTAAATATATTTAAVAAEKQAAGGGGSIAATTATTALATTSTAVVPTTTTTATTAAHQAITAEDGRRESLAAAAAAVAAEDLCVALPPRCATRKPPRKWRKRRVEAQVTKLVFFITASFCVSWMPFAVVSLIGVFGDASSITPLLSVLPGIMAKIGTVVNPLLYAIGHPHYRNVVRKHYRRARKRGKGGGGGGGGGGFGGGGRKVRARDGGRGGGGGGGGMHRGMPTTTRGMLSSVYFATILRRTDSISDHSPNVGTALQQHRGSARDV